MANRRKLLQSAALLSSVPLAGRAFSGTARAPGLELVVYDERHAPALAFAAFAADQGAGARAIRGDITALWQQELLTHWKSSNPLGGLTERPALFLLERLAWDQGLRVVFEAEHEFGADGGVRHRVLRSGDARLGAELDVAGESWPGVLADALLFGARTAAPHFHPTEAAMAARRNEGGKLHSWLIAPRRGACG